jgi:hypothetical protein
MMLGNPGMMLAQEGLSEREAMDAKATNEGISLSVSFSFSSADSLFGTLLFYSEALSNRLNVTDGFELLDSVVRGRSGRLRWTEMRCTQMICVTRPLRRLNCLKINYNYAFQSPRRASIIS